MNRNTLRFLAILLLLPSVAIGLLPYAAQYTDLLSSVKPFHLAIGGFQIAEYHRDVNGAAIGESAWQVWIVAVFAEVILLVLKLLQPTKVDTSKLSIYD